VILQPQIVKKKAEVSKMMIELTRDKEIEIETNAKIEIEQAAADAKAAEAKAIADDAQVQGF
jgi:hypothetical protein